MRANDLKKLEKLYDVGKSAEEVHHFGNAIDADLPNIRKLQNIILEDFSTETYGVSWWVSYQHLDLKRRILISDQLWQSLSSIQSNMIEARLQQLELFHLWDIENSKLKNVVSFINGNPHFEIPPKLSARDDFNGHMAEVHFKGFFTSLCSAIDCLCAAIVGVVGFKEDLFKIGYGSLERHFKHKFSYANDFQIKFEKDFKETLFKAGPDGWLKWIMDYRNMALHRGRRLSFSQLNPMPSRILTHTGLLGISTEVKQCLVSNPGVSEIESLKDGIIEALSEPAETSLIEVYQSSRFAVEVMANQLIDIWKIRASDPSIIIQPIEQWPKIRKGNHNLFKGYSPGTLDSKIGTAITSPFMVHRMRCSSLDDKDIENWKN